MKNKSSYLLAVNLCPTLAITSSLENSLLISIVIAINYLLSKLFLKLLDYLIPKELKLISNVLINTMIITVISMTMQAYFLEYYRVFGIYLPLIGLNSIIINSLERFQENNNEKLVFQLKILAKVSGFLILTGGLRELFGNGTLFGKDIFQGKLLLTYIFNSSAGALILVGFLLALVNFINNKIQKDRGEIDDN